MGIARLHSPRKAATNRVVPMAERKIRIRRRSSPKGGSSGSTAKKTSKASKAKTGKTAAKPKGAASAAKSGRRASSAKPKPAPNMNERMEGLQGWMAEIERKQERVTRFGGAAAIIAVLAAGGALALGVLNQQDAASKDDVDELTAKVNELGESLKAGTEEQLKTLNGRIDGLEQQVKTLQQTQTQNTQDIASLRAQGAGKPKAGGAGLGIQPAVPGATP